MSKVRNIVHSNLGNFLCTKVFREENTPERANVVELLQNGRRTCTYLVGRSVVVVLVVLVINNKRPSFLAQKDKKRNDNCFFFGVEWCNGAGGGGEVPHLFIFERVRVFRWKCVCVRVIILK